MIDGSVLQSAQRCFEKKSRVVGKMLVNNKVYPLSFLSDNLSRVEEDKFRIGLVLWMIFSAIWPWCAIILVRHLMGYLLSTQ